MRNLLYGVEVKLRAAKAGAAEVRVRGPELRIVMGRDLDDAQRRVLLSVFPKAQHGQRQIRTSIVEARGDWRDALTRVLEGLAACGSGSTPTTAARRAPCRTLPPSPS